MVGAVLFYKRKVVGAAPVYVHGEFSSAAAERIENVKFQLEESKKRKRQAGKPKSVLKKGLHSGSTWPWQDPYRCALVVANGLYYPVRSVANCPQSPYHVVR